MNDPKDEGRGGASVEQIGAWTAVGAELRERAPAIYDEVLQITEQITDALCAREVDRSPFSGLIFAEMKRRGSA